MPAFSGTTIQRLEPEFRALVDELIDTFIDKDSCDFMSDFANPYAGRVLTLLLGLPRSDAPELLRLTSDIAPALGVTFKQEIDKIDRATGELFRFCDAVIADRKRNPRDDFMTELVATTSQADGLSDEELRNLAPILVMGGSTPPATSSASACRCSCNIRSSGLCWRSAPSLRHAPPRR